MLALLSALWFAVMCVLSYWCHKQGSVGTVVKTLVIPTYLSVGMLPGTILLILELRRLFV